MRRLRAGIVVVLRIATELDNEARLAAGETAQGNYPGIEGGGRKLKSGKHSGGFVGILRSGGGGNPASAC